MFRDVLFDNVTAGKLYSYWEREFFFIVCDGVKKQLGNTMKAGIYVVFRIYLFGNNGLI